MRAARAQLLEAVPILVPGACPSQGGIGNQAPSVALSDHQWWLLQPGRTYGELFVDFTVSDANVIGANGTQDRLIGRWSFAQQPEHSRLRDEDILNGLVFANESGVYSTNYTALTGTSDELFWTLNVSEVEWFDRSPAAFVPDAAGLYVVSLNVTDACNATADEVTNIALRCDYDPRAGLTHNAARASVMNGRRALRFADFEHQRRQQATEHRDVLEQCVRVERITQLDLKLRPTETMTTVVIDECFTNGVIRG